MKPRRSGVPLFTLFVAVVFLPAAYAQKALPASGRHHCLWQVQGRSNVVYLLGSVHVLKAENYPLPAVIDAAFTNSAISAFETDIGAMDQPGTQLQFLSK